MNVLTFENLHDQDYIAKYATGLKELEEHVKDLMDVLQLAL